MRFTDGKLDGITSSLEEPYDLLSYTFSIWSFSPTSLSPLEERWRRKNIQTLKALLRGEEVDEDDIGQLVRLDAGKLLFTKEIVSYEMPEEVGYQYCELPTEEYLALYEQFLTLIYLLRNTCLNRNIANLKKYTFHVRFMDGKLDGIASSFEESYDLLSYTFSIWSFDPNSLFPHQERWHRKNIQTLKALLRGEEVDEDDIDQMVRPDAGTLLFTKEIVSYEMPEEVGYQYCELPTEEYLALYEQFLTLVDTLKKTYLES
ncbi:hypothetical protein [Flectobacillus sp. BAB-3569]|uniref:hypothetical protein n=1 Tax=Flectobacillus sp. BAB-3569 TaxID=1509483 RepID=UPI0011404E61|nr:hypothetical protein [Flectobacillus sp. BAB-3569]